MLCVIGAGSWGTALALQAANSGQPVTLWEYNAEVAATLSSERQNSRYLPGIAFPDNLLVSNDLPDSISKCSEVLVVVPSSAFRSLLQQLQPLLTPQQGLAWASKGLDQKDGELLHQVAQHMFGDDFPMAALSGPSFALEVAQNRPTAISMASNNSDLASRITDRLHSDTFRIYTSNDMAGVCLGGAYKNVLAIASGIADGLELGLNARAALITRGLAEMQRLGLTLGGQSETFMGLAGLGDLVLTCTGDLSRNRRLGMALARGESLDEIQSSIGQVTEGVETARAIHKLASTYKTDLPIAEEVYKVLFENKSPREAASGLLSREPRQEF
ncbi:MAG: glycerol-3-phosphate dehydrogenase [Gammaproteobacteria bacterium]|nr:MAG: glycerol-3-phosphate dehydrogenase [Gammaproteobacteria bacterium]